MHFHHVGIPTTEPKDGEHYVADSKLYVTPIDRHPYRVQWMRFEPGCPLPPLIQSVPHVAFQVDSLLEAIEGKETLTPPETWPDGATQSAFIEEGGEPVEFIQAQGFVVERQMLRYHHIGIATGKQRPGETHLKRLKICVTDHTSNPYGIQWMRYEPNCTLPDIVKERPHVAFQVEDLKAAIAGKDVIIEPNSPSPGVMVAFIIVDGAPIELLQIGKS